MADSTENYQLDLGSERVKSLVEDVIHVEKDDTMCKWQRHEPGAITVDKCSRLFTLHSQKWLRCYFSLYYLCIIHQIGNENTQTYEVEIVILS